MQNELDPMSKCAVIVAHPAHELQIYGLLVSGRPEVHVLTNGSGRSSPSRIASTAKLLRRTGCSQGSLFGQITDQQVYEALLAFDFDFFLRITRRLADSLAQSDCLCVVGDAAEGRILTHDICRAMINAAVASASYQRGVAISNLEFNVVGGPIRNTADIAHGVQLSQDLYRQKLKAAKGYLEVRTEVQEFLDTHGEVSLQYENFRLARDAYASWSGQGVPGYEYHARNLVGQGTYNQPVIFSDHVIPLLEEIQRIAGPSVLQVI